MRSLLLPLVTLPALTGACLLDENGPDAPEPPAVTSGTYRHFAQSTWTLPSSAEESRRFGFDFEGKGYVNNHTGAVMALLAGVGLDVHTASNEALASGELVILHSVRADSLVDDDSVAWRVMTGAPTGSPPRWDGSDVFRFAGDDGALVGTIAGGRAEMEWGTVVVPLPFFPEQTPMILPLATARVRAAISDTGCEGTMGGLMLAADIDVTLRRFAQQAITHIERNPEHELARSALDIFDTNNDGVISLEEMISSPIAEIFFDPDVDLDGDGVDDALSFGFGFTCEPAQFWAPGEV